MAAAATAMAEAEDSNLSDSEATQSESPCAWQRFSNWVHCICVVTFDLELGQALEVVFPGHAELDEKEKTNICYLAFPDSNSGCMGDTQFHVRMRRFSSNELRPSHVNYNKTCPTALQVDPNHLFGFVYFRQVKDANIRRGYLQKSVVIISGLPFTELFSRVVQRIAPEFFESACHDLDQWPTAVPGTSYHLPLLGAVIQCRLPSRTDSTRHQPLTAIHQSACASISVCLLSVFEPPLYDHLCPLIGQIQLLWELLLLGEPLVVMAGWPSCSAGVVQALVSLLWPLKYAHDYRPYFTIHDTEFREYTANKQDLPSVLLGVTNPFFVKTLQHWPHIVRMGNSTQTNESPASTSKMKRTSEFRTLENVPGVYTKYKPFLLKDKSFSKRLAKGREAGRPNEAQSALIRRYFLEMTQSFMIPLERYIAGLMPLQKQISPFKAPPCARQFDFDEFVLSLELSGPALTCGVKGDWNGLYRRFVRSVNFEHWYAQRQQEVEHKLSLLHLDVLCNTDFAQFDLSSFYEVELVDLVIKVREKLDFVDNNRELVCDGQRAKLIEQLRTILQSVNDDLRTVLTSNTQLRLDTLL